MRIALFISFIILSVYVFIASYDLPPFLFQPLGGDGYARIVSVLLVIASISWLVIGVVVPWIISRKTGVEKQVIEEVLLDSEIREKKGKTVLPQFSVIMVLYAVAVFTIGYFVSTFLFLSSTMILIVDNKREKIVRLCLLSAIITGVLYFLFKLVRIYLPPALLF